MIVCKPMPLIRIFFLVFYVLLLLFMCGIIGIYNNSNNIIDCLNKLQHRGKDGVGIAMNTKTREYYS